MDPAGQCFGYWGMAAGKAAVAARTLVEKLNLSSSPKKCAELSKEAAKIIREVHDTARDKAYDLEMSWVTEGTKGIFGLVPEEVLKEAEEQAAKVDEVSELSEDESG